MAKRLLRPKLTLLGGSTAKEWSDIVGQACERQRIECSFSSDGYPSDQTSFYGAGIPVLHFFSGSHRDYHEPSDSLRQQTIAARDAKGGSPMAPRSTLGRASRSMEA